MVLSLNLSTISLDFVPFYRHLEEKMDWRIVSVIMLKTFLVVKIRNNRENVAQRLQN